MTYFASPLRIFSDFRVTSTRDWAELMLRATIILFLVALIMLAIEGKIYKPLLKAAHNREWAEALLRPSVFWLLMGTAMLGFRTILWFGYRPFASVTPATAPMLTIIIPAYNEGAMVGDTVDSVAAADYPRDRLEILVIDDGSRDDTWKYIEAAARRHPSLVTAIRFPDNRGKRAALAEGFRRARGEIAVTIDSDSVIEPQTLLAMAGPFRHEKVGAVAGKVAVHNRYKGIIPHMLHVRFILSFDMLRAAQSTYGTVYCCPGALSAYRLSVVRTVLDRWMAQTFMGVPCTYGEDRALTNFVLLEGYDTVYQQTGVVHTVVPSTYTKLSKMFLRWERSYMREEYTFLKTVVWRRPWRARWIAFLESTMTNLRYPVIYASLVMLGLLVMKEPGTLLRLLTAMGVMATFYMLYYLRSERSTSFVYGVLYAYFSFFTLFWIPLYAMLTLKARSWLTR